MAKFDIPLPLCCTLLALTGMSRAQTATASPASVQKNDPMAMPTARKAVLSDKLVITVDGKATTFTRDELQKMPQRTAEVANGHTKRDESYTGVGLDDLLARCGLQLENGGAPRVYHSYVRAEGTDHYYVVFSATEFEPAMHMGDALVALMREGQPLGADGAFELVLGGEKKPARWVRNLASLKIVLVP